MLFKPTMCDVMLLLMVLETEIPRNAAENLGLH